MKISQKDKFHRSKRLGQLANWLCLTLGGTVFIIGIYVVLYSFYGLWIKELIVSATAIYFATVFIVGANLLLSASLFTGWILAQRLHKAHHAEKTTNSS